MISHKYKCIFIHIPRTAGSSIEKMICGDDWWKIEKSTKHLLASQSKQIYKDYWNDYFKFSIVRNPWDRMVSCLRFKNYFKLSLNNSIIDISGYKKLYSYKNKIVEFDHRFHKKENVVRKKHGLNTVYNNIIDEEIDWILKFENLYDEVEELKKILDIKQDFNFLLNKSKNRKNYKDYYNEKSKNEVEKIFLKDIEKHRYNFNDNIS